MRYMPCPLCNSAETRPVERRDADGELARTSFHFIFGVKFLTCGSCGFVFSDYIEPAILDFYYRKMCRRDASDDELQRLRDSSKANGLSQLTYLRDHLPATLGRVLDRAAQRTGLTLNEHVAERRELSDRVHALERGFSLGEL